MSDLQRFRYTEIKNAAGNLLLRPLLEVRLFNAQNSLRVIALLDSGADLSVLPVPLHSTED